MKKFDGILAKINKKFKFNLAMAGEDDRAAIQFRIPTGIPQLNTIIGGGLPAGRVVEVSGEESAGKTTLITQLISANPGLSVLHDIEGTFEKARAEAVGFDISRLAYDGQGDEANAETVMDALTAMIAEFPKCTAEEPLAIFLDSVAALITEQEEEKKTGDAVVAALPRVLSRGLKRVSKELALTNGCLVLVNQLRDKIGGNPAYGKQQDSVGGRALKFYSSVRIFLTVVKKIYKDRTVKGVKGTEKFREIEGVRVKAKVIKNKTFRPFLECEFCIMFDRRGIVWREDFFNTLVRYGVLIGEKGKSTYRFSALLAEYDPMMALLGDAGIDAQFTADEMMELCDDTDARQIVEQAAVQVLAAGSEAGEAEAGEDDPEPEDEM